MTSRGFGTALGLGSMGGRCLWEEKAGRSQGKVCSDTWLQKKLHQMPKTLKLGRSSKQGLSHPTGNSHSCMLTPGSRCHCFKAAVSHRRQSQRGSLQPPALPAARACATSSQRQGSEPLSQHILQRCPRQPVQPSWPLSYGTGRLPQRVCRQV